MAFAETQELAVKIDLKGNLKAGLAGAVRDIRAFDKATSNTQRSLGKFGSNIQKGIAVGLAATAGAFTAVVKAASDYESAFAGVRKTVSATEPQLQELSKQFRELSKQIPISAAELARLGEAGGALGVPTDQLKEFVRVTALLGVTTNLTADEAADSLGILGNVLHLTGDEYSKFASSLVALGNAGASTERDIVAIAERAGAAGALIGVSTENILGFSSAVASLGIESEAGGTALQKFFIDSAKAVAAGGKDLKTFAKTAGQSTKDFKKAFEKDAGAALQSFLKGLGKLPQAAQLKVLEDLGFSDARITRTLLGLANNTELVADQMNVANKAYKDNTALTKEAEQRFNTFDSQLQITKNTLTDMAITIGSKLLPKITPLLKRLNDFVNTHTSDIEAFGDRLAEGFGKFADEVGRMDWQPFIDGLKLSAQIAKDAIDIFRSLPDPLQKLLVAGFAVNKVTGGLLTGIGKDLFKLIGDQLLARGSSPANPMWVATVGGGLGGPGINAGAAGFAAGVIGKVFLVGMAAEVASLLAAPVQDLGKSIHEGIFGPNGDPLSDFGKAWEDWRRNADWPFGQKNAPDWLNLGGTPKAPPVPPPVINSERQLNTIAANTALDFHESQNITRVVSGMHAAQPPLFDRLAGTINSVASSGLAAVNNSTAKARDAIETARIENASRLTAVQAAMTTGLANVSSIFGMGLASADAHEAANIANAATRTTSAIGGLKSATSSGLAGVGRGVDETRRAIINKKTQVSITIPVTTNISFQDQLYKTTSYSKYGKIGF